MRYLLDIALPYAQAELRTAKESAGRLCWRVAGFAAAGLVAALGLGFLVLSFHLWLLRHVPAPDAALWTGLLCIAVAASVVLVVWLITRAGARSRHREVAKAAALAELQLLQIELEQGAACPRQDRHARYAGGRSGAGGKPRFARDAPRPRALGEAITPSGPAWRGPADVWLRPCGRRSKSDSRGRSPNNRS